MTHSRTLRRMRRGLSQLAVIGLALGALVWLGLMLRNGFAARGVAFSFDFLAAPAGFEISEGVTLAEGGLGAFRSDMTNMQALGAGLWNTLKVAVAACLLATVIGVGFGVCRLSTNWLIRKLAFWATEFLRNTPLLIQLTFWYVAVVLQLPGLKEAPQLLGAIVSQQGLWLPAPVVSGGCWLVVLAVPLVLLVTPAGEERRRGLGVAVLVILAIALGNGLRIAVDFPEAGRFRATGGLAVSPEYVALTLAITLNSAAYLGEIVRGAIEALPRGQWEAAEAIGLARGQVLRDVILPQVFRIVLPSFGNQYISLTKNTSLGIAIGYPDLFNVYGTVANQTGRSLEGVLLAMGIYLVLSWGISGLVNLANRRLKIPGVR